MEHYRILNFRIPFDQEANVRDLLAQRLGIASDSIGELTILRRSLDARQNQKNIYYEYALEFSLPRPLPGPALRAPNGKIETVERPLAPPRTKTLPRRPGPRPVVVGLGPAGMFVAYALTEAGFPPLVLEMGDPAEERQKHINQLWRDGQLDPNSNVQFGEGGAGFFSDGKLYTRIKSPLVRSVYEVFVRFGAKESILYDHHPHLGTDKLRKILVNFRNYILEKGAEIRFRKQMKRLVLKNGRVAGVELEGGEIVDTGALFLCVGHSARPLFRALHAQGVALEKKDFAVGFRVEHPQALINRARYGKFWDDPRLPAAEYDLSCRTRDGGSVYSFCMCPGGMVLLATSEKGRLVTNGMSFSSRRGELANAGLVAAVSAEMTGAGLFSGVEFQEAIEAKAFSMGDRYRAPAQRVADFLVGSVSKDLPATTYLPGLVPADLRQLYPAALTDQLLNALSVFAKKIPGFDGAEALLIAPETRTSSPLRFPRHRETFESLSTPGLYPLGEGAGYAGGITSSAVDGWMGVKGWLKTEGKTAD